MFEKVKEWFLGIVDKVKNFFTKDIKEDVTVNYGGLYILCLFAGMGIGECVINVMNFVPKLFMLNAIATMLVIYFVLASLVLYSVYQILKPKSYAWRAV